MRTVLIIFLILSVQNNFSQETGFINSKLLSIGDDHILVLQNSETNQIFNLKLYDVIPNARYKDSINSFIKTELHQEFYVNFERKKSNFQEGWIIYNCEIIKDSTSPKLLPCSKGNLLNLVLVEKGFYIYTGKDEFLKNKFKY